MGQSTDNYHPDDMLIKNGATNEELLFQFQRLSGMPLQRLQQLRRHNWNCPHLSWFAKNYNSYDPTFLAMRLWPDDSRDALMGMPPGQSRGAVESTKQDTWSCSEEQIYWGRRGTQEWQYHYFANSNNTEWRSGQNCQIQTQPQWSSRKSWPGSTQPKQPEGSWNGYYCTSSYEPPAAPTRAHCACTRDTSTHQHSQEEQHWRAKCANSNSMSRSAGLHKKALSSSSHVPW